jgi:hypothetical protein
MAQWFGPRTIGYGIGPRSWQGWLATAIFLAVLIGSRFVRPESFGLPHWIRPLGVSVVALGYLVLAFLTYEPD